MKKKISVPFVALITALAFTVTVMAFTGGESLLAPVVGHDRQTVDYFRYQGVTFNEADFTNPTNWTFIGNANPGSNPCITSGTHPCVVTVSDAALPAPSGTLNTIEKRFAKFLDDQPSAVTYASSNQTYSKQ